MLLVITRLYRRQCSQKCAMICIAVRTWGRDWWVFWQLAEAIANNQTGCILTGKPNGLVEWEIAVDRDTEERTEMEQSRTKEKQGKIVKIDQPVLCRNICLAALSYIYQQLSAFSLWHDQQWLTIHFGFPVMPWWLRSNELQRISIHIADHNFILFLILPSLFTCRIDFSSQFWRKVS